MNIETQNVQGAGFQEGSWRELPGNKSQEILWSTGWSGPGPKSPQGESEYALGAPSAYVQLLGFSSTRLNTQRNDTGMNRGTWISWEIPGEPRTKPSAYGYSGKGRDPPKEEDPPTENPPKEHQPVGQHRRWDPQVVENAKTPTGKNERRTGRGGAEGYTPKSAQQHFEHQSSGRLELKMCKI